MELATQRRERQRLEAILAEREKLQRKFAKETKRRKKVQRDLQRQISAQSHDMERVLLGHQRAEARKKFKNLIDAHNKRDTKRQENKKNVYALTKRAMDAKDEVAAYAELEDFRRAFDATAAASRRRSPTKEAKPDVRNEYSNPSEEKIRAAESLVESFDGDAFEAARSGRMDVVRAFCVTSTPTRLASLRHRRSGRTLLHVASLYGCTDVVSFLIDMGAEVDAVDTAYRGFTPLLEAARAGHLSICRHLITRGGADVRRKDHFGDTAVHWAARGGHGYLFLRLVEWANGPSSAGVSLLKLRNDRGRTARDVACSDSVRALYDQALALQNARSGEIAVLKNRLRKGAKRAAAAAKRLRIARGRRVRAEGI